MSKKTVIATGLAALVVGVVVGGATASVEPEVRTETKTVEVEVPGPTKTVTDRVEVEVTPQACLDALDEAEEVAHKGGEFADIIQGYLPLIQKAYIAGATQGSADAIVSKMNEQTAKVNDLNGRLSVTIKQYNESAAECRS